MNLTPFSGIGRLIGARALQTLSTKRVMIVGLGGVGSWAAESLARSGVGTLDLVDLDEICQSNINRQSHALHSTVGQPKAEILARRCRDIGPNLQINPRLLFYTAGTSDTLLNPKPDAVLDAIDSMAHKTHLLATCRKLGIPVVTTGGGGGKTSPEWIRTADLAKTYNDPLLARVRKILRQKHGFPRYPEKPFRIPAVFSPELPRYPDETGEVTRQKPLPNSTQRLDCAGGLGAASYITGTMGFFAASVVLRLLTSPPPPAQ